MRVGAHVAGKVAVDVHHRPRAAHPQAHAEAARLLEPVVRVRVGYLALAT